MAFLDALLKALGLKKGEEKKEETESPMTGSAGEVSTEEESSTEEKPEGGEGM